MFFRAIGLSLVIATLCAFVMAALTFNPGPEAEVAWKGKRQDRVVPAGGFKPARHTSEAGYGTYVATRG